MLHQKNGAGSGWLPGGGSYVAYTSPSGAQTTIVVEKVDPAKSSCQFEPTPRYNVTSERATFRLSRGGAGAGAGAVPPSLFVYWSNLATGTFLQRNGSVAVADDGTFAINVAVDDVITITTMDWARPTYPTPPADGPFPAAVDGSFAATAVGQESPLFAQMSGAFEVGASALRPHNTLQQVAAGFPVKWLRDDKAPFTQMGDGSWGATSVSVDVAAITACSVFVGVRGSFPNTDGTGLLFGVDTNRSVWFVANTVAQVVAGARTGAYPNSGPLATGKKLVFNTLEVRINGSIASATGSVNGKQVFTGAALDAGISIGGTGTVLLGTSDYGAAEFDAFAASGTSAAPSPAPPPPSPTPLPPIAPSSCKPATPGVRVRPCTGAVLCCAVCACAVRARAAPCLRRRADVVVVVVVVVVVCNRRGRRCCGCLRAPARWRACSGGPTRTTSGSCSAAAQRCVRGSPSRARATPAPHHRQPVLRSGEAEAGAQGHACPSCPAQTRPVPTPCHDLHRRPAKKTRRFDVIAAWRGVAWCCSGVAWRGAACTLAQCAHQRPGSVAWWCVVTSNTATWRHMAGHDGVAAAGGPA